MRQLGNMMSITPQSVKEIEEREKSGTITLKVLRQFGQVLNLKLVYGFIPSDGSLEKIIEQRALVLAKEIVNRTSASMKLENQENKMDDNLISFLKDDAVSYLPIALFILVSIGAHSATPPRPDLYLPARERAPAYKPAMQQRP